MAEEALEQAEKVIKTMYKYDAEAADICNNKLDHLVNKFNEKVKNSTTKESRNAAEQEFLNDLNLMVKVYPLYLNLNDILEYLDKDSNLTVENFNKELVMYKCTCLKIDRVKPYLTEEQIEEILLKKDESFWQLVLFAAEKQIKKSLLKELNSKERERFEQLLERKLRVVNPNFSGPILDAYSYIDYLAEVKKSSRYKSLMNISDSVNV